MDQIAGPYGECVADMKNHDLIRKHLKKLEKPEIINIFRG